MFPWVIGFVGYTHIPIMKTLKHVGECVNRKDVINFNVLGTYDSRECFISV